MRVIFIQYEKLRNFVNQNFFAICEQLELRGWKVLDIVSYNLAENVAHHKLKPEKIEIIIFLTFGHPEIQNPTGLKWWYYLDDYHVPETNALFQKCMDKSDGIMGPNALYLHHYYQVNKPLYPVRHCCIEKFYPEFNENPIPKLLISGAIDYVVYPLRSRLYRLADQYPDLIARQQHPGYNGQFREEVKPKGVGKDYYRILSNYLAAFASGCIYEYVLCKTFEIPACGTLLIAEEKLKPELEKLGFIDRVNYVSFHPETVMETVKWILDPINRPEIDTMRRAGMELSRTHHASKNRAEQIDTYVNDYLKG